MALNEMIAQGAQFKMPDPLEQYGRIAQIQQAQNQNALAQYQISSAQRADETNTNFLGALRAAGNDPMKIQQAYINAGKGKEASEYATSLLTQQKARGDIQKLNRDDFTERIQDINNNSSKENVLAHMQDINANASYSPEFKALANRKLTELSLMSDEDRAKATKFSGMTGAQKATAGMEERKYTAAKPTEVRLGNVVKLIDMNPNSLTYGKEVIPQQNMGITPDAASTAQTAANLLAFNERKLKYEQENPGFTIERTTLADGTERFKKVNKKTGVATDVMDASGVAVIGVNLPAQTAAIRQKFDQDKLDFERKFPGFTIEKATQADGSEKFKKVNKLTGEATDVMDVSGTPLTGAAKITLSPLATLQRDLTNAPPNSKQADQLRAKILKEITDTSQAQLKLAQDRFAWDKANPGYYTQALNNEDGSQRFVAVNRLTLKAYPITEAAIGSGTPPNIGAPLVGAAAGVVPTAVPAQTPGGPAMAGQPVPLTSAKRPSAFAEKAAAQKVQMSKDLTQAISELTDVTKDGGLIDQSTGSGAGRLTDLAAGFFGQAPQGAIAIGKLQPIADIALKMVPRFEGPQSDKDTTSYKQAAGQLADSSLPTKIRKEAGKTVLRLMKARKEQFGTVDMVTEGAAPAPAAAGGVVDFGSLR